MRLVNPPAQNSHSSVIGGGYDVANLIAEQKKFAKALKDRMGLTKAGKTLAHIVKQTLRTFRSSTAYQAYWTGIVEISGIASKFAIVPIRDENPHPRFRPGEYHLSEEWKERHEKEDVEFRVYWISFLSEDKTPTGDLTNQWEEVHKQYVGTVTFPRTDAETEDAISWSTLANAMGANPGNWIHDKTNSISEPSTVFGTARKIAYINSQEGRGALNEQLYQSVFKTGEICADLAQTLKEIRDQKDKLRHVSSDTAFSSIEKC